MKNSFSFVNDCQLGNQLVVLYHAFNICDNIENLYFPWFKRYADFFNISKLCDSGLYYRKQSKFHDLKWGDQTHVDHPLDPKFQELFLRKEHEDKVKSIVSGLNGDLVAIHIRHKDYKDWNGGKFYFEASEYLEFAKKRIEEWKLENPTIVVFSDERQSVENFSWDYTNEIPVYDMYLMSHFNYFISTYSTFSGVAKWLAKDRGTFKGDAVLCER